MIGINLRGMVPKFLGGGWTSEDTDNPVYSKLKSLTIKELRLLLDRLNQGIKNFDKAARIGFGITRLHPTYGIAMNLIDLIEDVKRPHLINSGLDFLANENGIAGKIMINAGLKMSSTPPRNFIQKHHARLGGPAIGAIGTVLTIPDYILDIKDLYNTIKE